MKHVTFAAKRLSLKYMFAVMLSEAKHLWFVCMATPQQVIRDSSLPLRMTE